jgi:ParB family chromosome partitioning protein
MEVVEIRVTESVLEANFGNEAQIEYVPYERLCRSPLNVRKKAPTGIEALAGTIVGNGLMQNLVVHPVKGSRAKQPKLGVCAGQRRLAALDLLFSQGKITKDFMVPVLIVSEGGAVAASLIENRERETMHIADECSAFRLLTEEGKSIAHISALFKVSEMVVRRALRIANLSPVLLDLLRDDKLDYEQAKVLALADDHAAQERVWTDAQTPWLRRPAALRAALTKAELDASENPLAKFVGLDAYEAADGYVRRDLFSDDQNAGYIADADLLHRLATDRLIKLSHLTRYWKPTRAGYFEHVPKDRIVTVVGETVSPQAAGELRGMKKGDAAAAAELRMTDSGWLPEVLRNREVPEHVTYGHWEDDEESDADSTQDECNDGDTEEAEVA